MKKLLFMALVVLSLLSFAVPVYALTGSIVLNEPQPINYGNTVTFTTSHDPVQGNNIFYVWLECEQTINTIWSQVYSQKKPEGSSFLLTDVRWNTSYQATCFPILVYEIYYGNGKVRHQYFEGQSFPVYP